MSKEKTDHEKKIDEISVERERFDLDQWKIRSPFETICTQLACVTEEQQLYRRNLETLVSVRKIYKNSDTENAALVLEIDAQVKKFVAGLRTVEIAADILSKLK
jgi:hypothetical protein